MGTYDSKRKTRQERRAQYSFGNVFPISDTLEVRK